MQRPPRLLSLLTSLLLAVAACGAAPAQSRLRASGIVKILLDKPGDKDDDVCTAFVVPGTGTLLLTAAHCVDGVNPVAILDPEEPVVLTLRKKGDSATDVAVLSSEKELLAVNPNDWATDGPETGEEAWLVGFPGPSSQRITLRGYVVSDETGIWQEAAPMLHSRLTLALPGAMLGQSGSPVFNAEGKIIAMFTETVTVGGTLQLAIPTKELRKFMR